MPPLGGRQYLALTPPWSSHLVGSRGNSEELKGFPKSSGSQGVSRLWVASIVQRGIIAKYSRWARRQSGTGT